MYANFKLHGRKYSVSQAVAILRLSCPLIIHRMITNSHFTYRSGTERSNKVNLRKFT